MERKQALILLCLVLAVSLVSFSLGVMVGRGGGAKAGAGDSATTVAARPVAPNALPSSEPDPAASTRNEAPPAEVQASTGKVDQPSAEPLSFYETLPRGDLPLGSGINLPPAAVPVERPEPAATSGTAAVAPPVAKGSPPTSPAAPDFRPVPPPPATGGYVVQLASFKDAAAAGKLHSQLNGKGYQNLFVEAADLGSKGVWHRVFAGPYADRSAAEQLAGRLRQEEKISPLVRKR